MGEGSNQNQSVSDQQSDNKLSTIVMINVTLNSRAEKGRSLSLGNLLIVSIFERKYVNKIRLLKYQC